MKSDAPGKSFNLVVPATVTAIVTPEELGGYSATVPRCPGATPRVIASRTFKPTSPKPLRFGYAKSIGINSCLRSPPPFPQNAARLGRGPDATHLGQAAPSHP